MEHKLEIIYRPESEIIPYINNTRTHSKEQIEKLKSSIKEFGMCTPIGIHNQTIVYGHARFESLKQLGYKEFPTVDLSHLSEAQLKAYIIADNRLSLDAGWDEELLKLEIESLQEMDFNIDLLGFSDEELKDFDLDIEDEVILDTDKADDVPEVVENPVIKLGDLIELGHNYQHRLLCGDSTKEDDVDMLMNGKKWDSLVTSPPYNQGGGSGDLLTNGKNNVRLYEDKDVDNKTKKEYFDFCIKILSNANKFRNEDNHSVCWNVAYNAKSRDDYGKIIFSEQNPFDVKETIIWDKGHAINLPQVGIYSRRCEFVFVMSNCEKYLTSQIYNDCRWNIYNISSKKSQVTDGDVEHRAAYPVEFSEKMITDFSLKNSIIYEPFNGSGTNIISCENTNRISYSMEIYPKYVQLSIDRYVNYISNQSIKINGIEVIWEDYKNGK